MSKRIHGGSSPNRDSKYKSHEGIRLKHRDSRMKRCMKKLQNKHPENEYYIDKKDNIRKRNAK